MSSGSNPSYTNIGSFKSNAHIKAKLTGTLNNYTVLAPGSCEENGASIPSSGRYQFSGGELSLDVTIADSIAATGAAHYVFIKKIKVYLDNTLVRTIKLESGDIFWQHWDYIDFKVYNVNSATYLTIPLDSYKKHYGGNPWGSTDVESVSAAYLYSAGYHSIYVEFEYQYDYGEWQTAKLQLGRVHVEDIEPYGISLVHKNCTKKFYKNATFNSNNLEVWLNYKYKSQFGGNFAGTYNYTSNAVVTTPDMTSAGTKSVNVSLGSYSDSYSIEVVGVSSVSENTSTNFKYLVDTGNPGTPSTITIRYTDGTSRTSNASGVSFSWVSGDFNATGNRTWKYKIYDSNTAEWIETTVTKKCFDVSKLAVTTAPTKKVYQTNESFDKTGMVVTGTYSDAGTRTMPHSELTIEPPNMAVVAASTNVTISARNKSTTTPITVHGLTNVRIYVPDSIKKYLKGSGVYSNAGLKVYYTCSDQAETELDLSSTKVSIDQSAVDFGTTGTYQIIVSVTHEGNTMSQTYDLTVYAVESLTLSSYKAEFIHSGTAPTFSAGGLTVVATMSDGTTRTLSNSEYSVSAPDNMEVGRHTVTVSATIGNTVSATYEIEVVEDYPEEITSVDLTNWNDTFVEGDGFDKTGIVVKATMHSGLTNKEVDFSTSLDGQVFGDDITASTSNFSITVETHGDDLTVAYNSNLVKKSGQSTILQAKYDILDSISITSETAGMFSEAGSLRSYRCGDHFITNGLKVTASYRFSGNVVVTGYELSYNSKSIDSSYVFISDDMGQQTITVSYKGVTTTYTIKVYKLFSLTVTLDENSKTLYVRHQHLDMTQTAITVTAKHTLDGENAAVGSLTIDSSKYTILNSNKDLEPDNLDGESTTFTVSYTEGDVTETDTFDINVRAMTSVALNASKFSVNFGENFSLVGKTLTVDFNVGSPAQSQLSIDANNQVTIDGTKYDVALSLDSLMIKNKVENVTAGLTYGDETKYATFTIHCIYLDSISIDASYYSGTLYAGETISLSNLVVSRTLKSTDTDDANYPDVDTLDNDDVQFNIGDGHILAVGNNSITATYSTGLGNTLQTKNASVTLTALQVALQSISVDDDALEKALSSYVEGQSLNLNGLVISAVFNRTASNRTLALTECKVYFDDEEKYYTSAVKLDDDEKDVVIAFTYDGVTKTATVGQLTVAAKVLSSISVKNTSTNKTSYLIGDLFSTEGLILEATYNDGYQEIITKGYTTSYDAYKTTAFTSAAVDADPQAVTVSLTIGETTKTCTYNITVGVPALESLRLDTTLQPLSVTNGSPYTYTGLVVYGVFENGYEEQLTITTDWNVTTDLTRDGSNNVSYASNNLGTKTVVITATNPYDNLQAAVTANLNVTVTPNLQLVDIRLKWKDADDNPDNGEYAQEYRVGDTFNAKGVVVEALFKDTEWMEVSGWETSNPTLGSVIRSGGRFTVTVSYTSQGVQLTADYQITVLMPYDSGLVEENTYKVAFNVTSITHEEATIEFSPTTQLPLFRSSLIDIDDSEENSTYGLNVYTGNNASADCIGYVKLGSTSEIDGSVIDQAQVILFDDPVNPIDGQGNILVKFPHYVSGYADRINKCHFGTIYNKRLFVSGNPDYPNIDWHSSEVNSAQVEHYNQEEDKDLTYFSDLDYCKYGSENSAVVGYDIYRDGTLLVFKERAQHEATIYTRTTQLVNASSYDGTVVNEGQLAEEAYPCFEVNPNGGSGAISPYSIINFVGETLVLTKDGLKAITSKEVTYNNAKYSYDVSSHINNKLLKNNDLNYALISQYKEKLLLRTDEGLYVGEYSIRDTNSEYEWYFCDNINAYYFFQIDDELYFSDKNGNINRFLDDDSILRKDKPRTYIGLGGTTLSIDANTDVIIVSKDYASEVKEGREFHLLNKISTITGTVTDESQIYAKLGDFINKNTRDNYLREELVSFDQTAYEGLIDPDNNEIIIKSFTSQGDVDYERMNQAMLFFYDYRRVYVDNIDGSVYSVGVDKMYRLKRVQTSTPHDYRFQLIDEDNNVVSLLGVISLRMSFRVNELAVAYISNVSAYGSDGGKQFRVSVPLKASNESTINVPLDLIYYNSRTTGSYRGVITDHSNVISYYVTKPFNLGHDLYQKTIYMWSIINDTQIASMMNVGYIASRKYADFKVAVKEVGGARQLAYSEEFNMAKLHFTNDKLPHIYNRSRLLPRVGYIRFMFSNDEGTRMVLSKLEIIYSYSLLMKGVK